MIKRILPICLILMLTTCFTVYGQSSSSNGTVEFNKSLYTGLYTPASVTVRDQDLNINPATIDKASVLITSSADPKGIVLILNETNANTGIFTGNLKFSTAASSSISGALKVGAISSLTAQYADAANSEKLSQVVNAVSEFRFTEAVISTSAINNKGYGNMLDININEPDANNPDRTDYINVKVSAGSRSDGLTVRLEETGINTGIFNGTAYFTDREANKKLLYMYGYDKVSVKYTDNTIPQGGHKEIVNTIDWDYQSSIITLDNESYYGYNASAEITLYNMEINTNSDERDTVFVDVEASNSKSLSLELKETKANSGKFTGKLYFGRKVKDSEKRLKMEGADSFTVSYINRRNKSDEAQCSAYWSPQNGKLLLNREIYYGNAAAVLVTLQDWDVADDPSEMDKVDAVVRVKGTSRKRTISLTETKSDSGIFSKTFYINGGSGKTPSIDVKAGEMIEVEYVDEDTESGSEEVRTTAAVWLEASKAELTLDQKSYKGFGSTITISLTDPGCNKHQNAQENVKVLVKTSVTGKGLVYALKETGVDTGVFSATLKLYKDMSGYGNVKVGETDTITVTFVDKNVSVSAGFVK